MRDMLGILVDVNLKSAKGRDFLEIDVEPHPYPVSYKGRYYFRSGSTKQELKCAALDRFLLRKQGKHWDAVPVPNVMVRDFDDAAFKHFRTMSERSGRMDETVLHDSNEAIVENLRQAWDFSTRIRLQYVRVDVDIRGQ